MAAASCGLRIARAEVPADDRLRGDRDRIEREREEVPELPRDLMRGDLDVADARRDRRRGDEHREQRRGAHGQVTADDRRGAYVRAIRARRRVRAPHVAAHDHQVRGCRGDLRDHRAPCRAGDAPVEAVHEQDLEAEVEHVRGDRDHERCARVLEPAQVSGAREGDQHHRRAEQTDPQVRQRVRMRPRGGAHHVDDPRRQREPDDRQRRRRAEREPDTGDAVLGRGAFVARADPPGDRGGRAVGQEVEDPERRRSAPCPAIASPPSGRVPRRPTIAVSASTYSGSATSAPNAGRARRQISRSS